MRERRHELRAEVLESAVVSRVAEGVDRVVVQRHGHDREPKLTASHLDRDGLRARGAVRFPGSIQHWHERRARRPARNRLLRTAAAHLHGPEARDCLGSLVPELHYPAMVDDEEAVAET